MKKLTPEQLLNLIETLIVLNYHDENTLLEHIYRIVHSHSGTCVNPHHDWVKETVKTYKELKKRKEL